MQRPGLLLLWYWIMHLILRGKRWYIQRARKEEDEIGISRDERKKESLLICQLFVSLDPLMSNFFLICPLDRSRSWSSGGHHWKIFWWPWNQILFSFLLSLLQFLLKTPFLWNRPIFFFELISWGGYGATHHARHVQVSQLINNMREKGSIIQIFFHGNWLISLH